MVYTHGLLELKRIEIAIIRMHIDVLDPKVPVESTNGGMWPRLDRLKEGFGVEDPIKQKLKETQSAPPGQRLSGKD